MIQNHSADEPPVCRLIMAFLLISLTLTWPVSGKKPGNQRLNDVLKPLYQKIEIIKTRIKNGSPSPHLQVQLTELLIRAGQYKKAEQLIKSKEMNKLTGSERLRLEIQLNFRTYQFKKTRHLLTRADTLFPHDDDLRLLKAEYHLKCLNLRVAEKEYRDLLRKNPDSFQALLGLAWIHYYRDNFLKAEELINRSLKANPGFSKGYLFSAKLYRMRRDNRKWRENVKKAINCDPFNPQARAALADVYHIIDGDMKKSCRQNKLALVMDPYCFEANHSLGRGGSAVIYKDHQSGLTGEMLKNVNRYFQLANIALGKRKLAGAESYYQKILQLDPRHIRSLLGIGFTHYFRKNYHEALSWFFKVINLDPDYGMAYYGIARTLARKLDQINVLLPDAYAEFLKKEPPPLFPFLTSVFVNYHQCDPDLHKIIRQMVSPVSRYLKTLKNSGATFYFMDMHKFLWETPHQSNLRNKRTFDGRLWDDLKGIGGYHAVSNFEQQSLVKYNHFNVAAHEFAHQIHWHFTAVQGKKLMRLYQKAKKEKRTLDWYADANWEEYFAQGFEAYVSNKKLLNQKYTSGHTRKELQEKDPRLYQFIVDLNRTKTITANEVMGFVVKMRFKGHSLEDKLKICREGLRTYKDHPLLLNALGRINRKMGNTKESLSLHQRSLRLAPNKIFPYLSLADHLLNQGKVTEAIRILQNRQKTLSHYSDFHFQMGELLYYSGDIDGAEKEIRAGLKIDPYPYVFSYAYAELGYFKWPLHTLAGILRIKRNFKGAEKNIRIMMEDSGLRGSPHLWEALAAIYLKTGQIDKGKKLIDTALNWQPESEFLQQAKARYLAAEGKKADAILILRKLIKLNPAYLTARVKLIDLLKQSKPQEARYLIRKGMKMVSQRFDPLFVPEAVSRLYTQHAFILQKQGRLKEAVKYYEKALGKLSYNEEAGEQLALLLKKLSRKINSN